MKTADLKAGAQMDALVAMAQGWEVTFAPYGKHHSSLYENGIKGEWYVWEHHTGELHFGKYSGWEDGPCFSDYYSPSSGNAQTYELIEKFNLSLFRSGINALWWEAEIETVHTSYVSQRIGKGETPAEAICKAVIASKWGDEIPNEIWEKVA